MTATDPVAAIVAWNAVAVWAEQKLKASSLVPFVTNQTEKINKVVSVALSALGAAGMTFTFAHTTQDHGAGQLVISYAGLTLMNFIGFAYHMITNYATSKAFFKAGQTWGMIKP
jgi:hypothetical protein